MTPQTDTTSIKNVVIVGGGTSGWMTASMLAKLIGKDRSITLIESDDIGTVGVGEATIPPFQLFNSVLGLDEADLIKHTQATFKLGIQFENWGKIGDRYMHAFGDIGKPLGFTSFHHYWLKAKQLGHPSDFWDFSLNYQAAKNNKFAQLRSIPNTSLGGLVYAYHLDASLYGQYLRRFSETNGVKRIEGKVESVNLNPDNGFIQSLTLSDKSSISGDLFIDCSGFRALLIEQALQTGYEDWSHWLPCDRALAVQSHSASTLRPYTRAIAHQAGWQWQIPLQKRTGNGHVYCSKFISDELATSTLMNNLPGAPLTDPRTIAFTTGKRKKCWNKNCVAIGLSSGFLEPLESTSLHMVQSAILRLVKLFPSTAFHQADIDEYNRQTDTETAKIRDFIILHYRLTTRTDSEFWQYCQSMDIPDSLAQRIALFASHGRIFRYEDELFSEAAWQQVMLGQGMQPQSLHPITEQLTREQVNGFMSDLSAIIGKTAQQLPLHKDFINQHCKSN